MTEIKFVPFLHSLCCNFITEALIETTDSDIFGWENYDLMSCMNVVERINWLEAKTFEGIIEIVMVR